MFFKKSLLILAYASGLTAFAGDKAPQFSLGGKGFFLAEDGKIQFSRFMQNKTTKSYTQPFLLTVNDKKLMSFSGPLFVPGFMSSEKITQKEFNEAENFIIDEGITINSDLGYTRKVKLVEGGMLVDIKLRDGALRREFKEALLYWNFSADYFKGRKIIWGDKAASFPLGPKPTVFLVGNASKDISTMRISLTDELDLGVIFISGFKVKTFRNGIKGWFYAKGSLPLYRLDLLMDKDNRCKFYLCLLKPGEAMPKADKIIEESTREVRKKIDKVVKGNLITQGSSFETGNFDGFTGYSRPSFWNLTEKTTRQPEIDGTTAVDGRYSMRIYENCRNVGVLFNPVQFKRYKKYTLSMYLKSDKPTEINIGTGYVGHSGGNWNTCYGKDFLKTVKVGKEWKRYSMSFTPEDFGYLGYWTFGLAFDSSSRKDFPNTKVWVDAVQLEEGDLSPYAPAKAIEIGAVAENKYRLFPKDKDVALSLFFRNNSAKNFTGNITCNIQDYWGLIVATKQIDNAAVPAKGNTLKQIKFKGLKRGWYKALLQYADRDDEEVIFGVYTPQPADKVPTSWPFGMHRVYEGSIGRELGFGWSRLFFGFPFLNPKNKDHDFSYTDEIVAMGVKQGIQMMPVLGDGMHVAERTGTPWFADKVVTLVKGKILALPSEKVWKYTVSTYVRRYKDRIKAWEMLNESNCLMPPEVYLQYLKWGYEAAKEADPECIVIGLCATSDMGGKPLPWSTKVIELGGWKYLDAVSLHVYSNQKPEELDGMGEDKIFRHIKALCAKYGKQITVWNTEKNSSANNTGYSRKKFNIPGNIYTYNKGRVMGSFKTKGENFVREGIITSVVGGGPFFWHCMLPNTLFLNYFTHAVYLCNPNYYEFDLAPRPELIAVNGMTSLLYGREKPAGEVYWGGINRCYLYTGKKGTMATIWNWKTGNDAVFKLPHGKFQLYDYFGEPIACKPGTDGNYVIKLDTAPKYLVFDNMDADACRTLLEAAAFPSQAALKVNSGLKLLKDGRIALEVKSENNLSKPYSGTIKIVTLPKGWNASQGEYKLSVSAASAATVDVVFDKVAPLSTTANIVFEAEGKKYSIPVTPFDNAKQLHDKLYRSGKTVAREFKKGTVKIDGDLNEWSDVPGVYIYDARNERDWNNVLDCSAEMKFGWDREYLYFACRIYDDKIIAEVKNYRELWRDDSIEIFLDLDNSDRKDDFKMDDSTYRLNADDFHGTISPAMFGGAGPGVRWKYLKNDAGTIVKSKILPDGYIIEAAIPWEKLAAKFKFDPAKGKEIGMTFVINDQDITERFKRKRMIWHGDFGVNKSPKSWGRMKFE